MFFFLMNQLNIISLEITLTTHMPKLHQEDAQSQKTGGSRGLRSPRVCLAIVLKMRPERCRIMFRRYIPHNYGKKVP